MGQGIVEIDSAQGKDVLERLLERYVGDTSNPLALDLLSRSDAEVAIVITRLFLWSGTRNQGSGFRALAPITNTNIFKPYPLTELAKVLKSYYPAGQFPVAGCLPFLQPQAFDDHDDHCQCDEDQECSHGIVGVFRLITGRCARQLAGMILRKIHWQEIHSNNSLIIDRKV